jgi:asparagine synthase (glutamine-hydrolysing)
MSAIFGILNTDQAPLARELLSAMAKPILHYGRDGLHTHIAGSLGLGYLQTYNTPESFHEKQPYSENELTITASARLDNRAELCDIFNIPNAERRTTSDDVLILRAYQKWSPKAVMGHLLGDFSFAVWDAAKQSFYLACDPVAAQALYYHHGAGTFAFASDPRALLALPQVPQDLDEESLLVYDLRHSRPRLDGSFYRAIKKLPPASALIYKNGSIHIQTYWQPQARSTLRLSSLGEYCEALREVLKQAVDCRLRSAYPLGSHLSGGLDSSAVTVFADRKLASQGMRLSGVYTTILGVHPESGGGGRDETRKGELVCEQEGLTYTKLLRSPDDLVTLLKKGFPGTPFKNIDRDVPITRHAEGLGIRTILSGWGGNGTLTWFGQGALLDLFKRGRWGKMLREAGALAAHHHTSRRSALKRYVFTPLVPVSIRKFRERGHPAAMLRFLAMHQVALQDLFPAEYDYLYERAFQLMTLPGGLHASQRVVFSRDYHYERIQAWYALTAEHGIEYRYPFLDRRVIDFAFSLPPEMFLHEGWERYLFRVAMEGILPDEVRWQPKEPMNAVQVNHLHFVRQGVDSYLLEKEERTLDGNLYLLYGLRLARILAGVLNNQGQLCA